MENEVTPEQAYAEVRKLRRDMLTIKRQLSSLINGYGELAEANSVDIRLILNAIATLTENPEE